MKPRVSIFSFVLLLLFVKTCPVFCQQIIFNKVLPPDGKTFEHVTGITQDVNGYMWYATKKGLYSYDGYHMTYKNNPLNPNSLMSNALESVFADSMALYGLAVWEQGLTG